MILSLLCRRQSSFDYSACPPSVLILTYDCLRSTCLKGISRISDEECREKHSAQHACKIDEAIACILSTVGMGSVRRAEEAKVPRVFWRC